LESFIEEMKRYLGFTEQDVRRLQPLGPMLEKYFPELAERFYAQIPLHPDAARVFAGGEAQVRRLKQTLQQWARGLFSGVYDENYAEERYQIGFRHVRIGLDQKYVISAMGIVRAFLIASVARETPPGEERKHASASLNKILDLDLNLMCESYMHATLDNLRSLNQQLENANLELAEASRSKDEFLAHVSHELRTPLNSILGFSKMILDGLCATAVEERELLRDVFSSGQHLLRLVNDLIDIRRIEEGRLLLHSEELNLRQVIDSTLPLVAVQAAEKKIQLVDETFSCRLPPIRADELRLRQVLLNLLTNAVKFTAQGSVRLRARTADTKPDAAFLSSGLILRLEIEDTGIGIPADKREAVFGKFVQIDSAQARNQRGAGLGLAISRRLVELMGGSIGLGEGSNGQGTLVWFTLPIPQPSQVASRADRSQC
jgi:signal transduction histidine kinase